MHNPTLFLSFLQALLFTHLSNTSWLKNLPFFCQTIIFEKPFSRSLLLHLPFNKLMPITNLEGIKHLCNPSGTQLLTFMREREMGEWLVTTVYNSPYRTNLPLTFTFAIVRSRRGSKRKIIRMILTVRIETISNALQTALVEYPGIVKKICY